MAHKEERRRNVRIFLPSNQVRIVCGPYMALVGKVIDISVGGVRFTCESSLDGCDTVEMDIVLPHGPRLRADCKIIHTERDAHHPARLTYGAQFLSLDDDARAALTDFIANKIAEDSTNDQAGSNGDQS